MVKKKIRKLKNKLNKLIEDHGRDSTRVLEISRKLDLHIVKEMKRRKNEVNKYLGINLEDK